MPKRYPPNRKSEALELLAIHDKVSTVQRLTGIPATTLYRWRDQEFPNEPDLSVKKDFPFTEKVSPKSKLFPNPTDSSRFPAESAQTDEPSTTDSHSHLDAVLEAAAPAKPADINDPAYRDWLLGSDDLEAASPEINEEADDLPLRGVPGKTYPYPLEEDEDPDSRYEEFRELRDKLLDHARDLANDLKPTDPDINLRSLALARILDRVQQLDSLLPDLNPERVIRFEYVYDGAVHNVPPGQSVIEDEDEVRREITRTILEEGVID